MVIKTYWIGIIVKEYKIKQKMYHLMNESDDLITGKEIKIVEKESEIVDFGKRYFWENLTELVYPSKSYSVALIYAYLLNKYFNEDFYSALSDHDLLYGNDKYFKPYFESKHIYDQIIDEIGMIKSNFKLNEDIIQVKKTVEYFRSEFLINEDL